jgi:CRISPR-associated endonuclease/helicase Cas3
MLGPPTDFWGKLQRDDAGGVVTWHPLLDHCADVAAVAEVLLGLPLWMRRLARLAGLEALDAVVRARLSVLAALHDLGKLNLGFQAKGRPDLGTTAGHVSEGVAALWEECLRPRLAALTNWGPGAAGLLVTAISHHGRPQSVESSAGHYQRAWWAPQSGLDPGLGADRLLAACRRWFPAAFVDDGRTLPDSPAFEHAFAGLVMLADWIGSDTTYFPYSKESDGDRMSFSAPAAAHIVVEMGLDAAIESRLDAYGRSPFDRVTAGGYVARPAQAAVAGLPAARAETICVLESETGSGKTEAALAHFVRLYEMGEVDGLYFALPTRTAATQIFERVRVAAGAAFAQPPPVVLAVPGYLRVDDAAGRRLPHFEVLWPDRDRFRYRAWAAEQPKRYLAGAIVIGTIDQVLLSALVVGHAHLRATALLRHLLVVDEVHASDAYMTRILEEVLARHFAAGGHALLLSATLGAEARGRLLAPRGRSPVTGLIDAMNVPYPLVTLRDHADTTTSIATAGEASERAIALEPSPWLEVPERVAAAAMDAARAGAKVLVIKNTVRDCVATQRAVERMGAGERALLFSCQGIIAPHHARFARVDREALDRALEARIGKSRGHGGCVVVATQTVQQSLDIDADLLMTDLCPADVLLQRIGRLHRHVRDMRPAGFGQPRAVVLVPAHRDLGALLGASGRGRHHHGLGSVYPDLRVLEATWRLLERHPVWRIPTMNRLLVESSVHSQALAAIAEEGGERWSRHAMEMAGAERGQSRHAELNVIDWTRPYSEMAFPDRLEDRISTRLGEGDRRAQFERPIESPFGGSVSELVLRAAWTAGLAADECEAADVESGEGVTRFRVAARKFVYDRMGLRPDREEEDRDDGP